MAYIINRYKLNNQEAITTVQDGTVNYALDIGLVGKNYAGYGEVQNETFVHMLENFAGDTPPAKAITGQVWYDNAKQSLRYCTGIVNNNRVWKPAGVDVSSVEPQFASLGHLWLNDATGELSVRTVIDVDGQGGKVVGWVNVGPETPVLGETTRPVSLRVPSTLDPVNGPSVVAITVEDSPTAVFSRVEFTPATNSTVITNSDYPIVKKGVTIIRDGSLSFAGWEMKEEGNNLVFKHSYDPLAETPALVPSNSNFTLGSEDQHWDRVYAVAMEAEYADLAEKYLPDMRYETGTVVMVGGDKEITASMAGKRAIGAISAKPAYMMNKSLKGGQYVALKGRIPVKVNGKVQKGDELVADNYGCAKVGTGKVFAIALETSVIEGVKLVECLIL